MNQRKLEDRGETTEQLLKKRVPELEQQLAAEKARADRLEKDLDERADADMANYALHAKLDAEKAHSEKVRKALELLIRIIENPLMGEMAQARVLARAVYEAKEVLALLDKDLPK